MVADVGRWNDGAAIMGLRGAAIDDADVRGGVAIDDAVWMGGLVMIDAVLGRRVDIGEAVNEADAWLIVGMMVVAVRLGVMAMDVAMRLDGIAMLGGMAMAIAMGMWLDGRTMGGSDTGTVTGGGLRS